MKVTDLTVRDIMTANVLTLPYGEDLDLAEELMRLERIRHLPVVKRGRLVGLVTHRDIMRAQASSLAKLDAEEQQSIRRHIAVREIMTADVRTIAPDAMALEAAMLMNNKKYGCLPVVEGDKLVGIVTEADFLKLIVRVFHDEMIDSAS